jgi:serine/threonine protein phosphatase PrpC
VGWTFASSSVTGTSHIRNGTECQDAHLCNVLAYSDGRPVMLLVAADGAGSARLGGTGARLACESVRDQFAEFFRGGERVSNLTDRHARAILAGVRECIADVAGQDRSAKMRDYAATLLFAVVSPEVTAFGQIGDGAIVTCDGSQWRSVFKPERGMYANETYFVTQEGAEQHLQFAMRNDPVTELAVFTDGLERLLLDNALGDAHAPVFEKMFAPLRATREAGRSEPLSKALGAYLASPAVGSRTDDDVTLMIARRA